uniref:Uncharacterized protein n=1 Tax=viral metagenome TaxID=1070528 RepID=A0A6C0C252_9ZZZZ
MTETNESAPTTKNQGGSFGDFQENVGTISARINEVVAWIAFIICSIISTVMFVGAYQEDPNDAHQNRTTDMLVALIPLGFGLLIVIGAHSWRKVVSHNRGAAQFAGLLAEGDMLSNLIH